MRQEYRFAAAMEWLLRSGLDKDAEAGMPRCMPYAEALTMLRGRKIPGFIVQTFANPPRGDGGLRNSPTISRPSSPGQHKARTQLTAVKLLSTFLDWRGRQCSRKIFRVHEPRRPCWNQLVGRPMITVFFERYGLARLFRI
jgi:hypothetical protein